MKEKDKIVKNELNYNEGQCPYTGQNCNDYGSGYCDFECPNNPENKDEE